MEELAVAIYCYRDDEGTVYYVGQTSNPRTRHSQHLTGRPKIFAGLKMNILEWVKVGDANRKEMERIDEYKKAGQCILNRSRGITDKVRSGCPTKKVHWIEKDIILDSYSHASRATGGYISLFRVISSTRSGGPAEKGFTFVLVK